MCVQEKELKMFREKQKQEMKLLKQELDMMPKGDNKKENMRKAREAKEIELQEKVGFTGEGGFPFRDVMIS